MEKNDNVPEESSLQPVGEDNQYLIESELEPKQPRNWPMLVALAVAALAFAVLVFFAGRWVYHSLHNKNTVKPAPANTKSLPKTPTGASSTSTPNPGSSSNSASSNSSTSGAGTQLVNTGPGDVAAIFLLSSFAAASLHYVISLRKQA